MNTVDDTIDNIDDGDDFSDMDVFDFDSKLSEITSKIDHTMKKVNEQYPEKKELEQTDEAAENHIIEQEQE